MKAAAAETTRPGTWGPRQPEVMETETGNLPFASKKSSACLSVVSRSLLLQLSHYRHASLEERR